MCLTFPIDMAAATSAVVIPQFDTPPPDYSVPLRVEGGRDVNINIHFPNCYQCHSYPVPCCYYHYTGGTYLKERGRRRYPSLPPEPCVFFPCLTRRQLQIIDTLRGTRDDIRFEALPNGIQERETAPGVPMVREPFKVEVMTASPSTPSPDAGMTQNIPQILREEHYDVSQPLITSPPEPQKPLPVLTKHIMPPLELPPLMVKSPPQQRQPVERKAAMQAREQATWERILKEEGKLPHQGSTIPSLGPPLRARMGIQPIAAVPQPNQAPSAESTGYTDQKEEVTGREVLFEQSPSIAPLHSFKQPLPPSAAKAVSSPTAPTFGLPSTSERLLGQIPSTYHTTVPIHTKTVTPSEPSAINADRFRGIARPGDSCLCGWLCRSPGVFCNSRY